MGERRARLLTGLPASKLLTVVLKQNTKLSKHSFPKEGAKFLLKEFACFLLVDPLITAF